MIFFGLSRIKKNYYTYWLVIKARNLTFNDDCFFFIPLEEIDKY